MTPNPPRLLDLCCCAGGATKGYQDAGWHVTGVDIDPQPNYCGDEFVQADAIEYLRAHGHEYDARHGSPPCQSYSGMTNCRPGLAAQYPQLIDVMRYEMQRIGGPWIIENVAGSGLPQQDDMFGAHGLELCGSMFGLPVRRHRVFEVNWQPAYLVPSCVHKRTDLAFEHKGERAYADALGCDWMSARGGRQAIPPAFTEFIGLQLREHLASERAA